MGAAVCGGATAVAIELGSSLRAFCTDGVVSTRSAVLEVAVLYLLEIRGPGRGASGRLGSDLLKLGLEVFPAVFSLESIPRSRSGVRRADAEVLCCSRFC